MNSDKQFELEQLQALLNQAVINILRGEFDGRYGPLNHGKNTMLVGYFLSNRDATLQDYVKYAADFLWDKIDQALRDEEVCAELNWIDDKSNRIDSSIEELENAILDVLPVSQIMHPDDSMLFQTAFLRTVGLIYSRRLKIELQTRLGEILPQPLLCIASDFTQIQTDDCLKI